jgi:recombination protein RecT
MSEIQTVGARALAARRMIDDKWGDIQKCLPAHVTPERMLRVIQNALGKNPKLLECTPLSLISAITISSELGLEINTPLGLAYVIPYEQSVKVNGSWQKTMMAQFQLGYMGAVTLVKRSGAAKYIYAETVYANDKFSYKLGLHRDLIHEPATSNRGDEIGYYAVAYLPDGDAVFTYLSKADAEAHALQYSKAYQYDRKEGKATSAWSTNFGAMAKKTAVLKVVKYLPKAAEDVALSRALELDRNDVIDVAGASIPLDSSGAPDPVKQNSQAARDLIAQFNDKIPGGLTVSDFEAHLGKPIADADPAEVADAIMEMRDKCNLIMELLREFPDFKTAERMAAHAMADIEALYTEMKESVK